MADDSTFRLKRISYNGRDVPVLMQNENGPCPLLGLSNVLLLRGDISIHPDVPEISFSELCARLGEFMLESNVLSESNAELAANQRQNLSDGMALFPKLLRGLDVNVRFTSIDAFEYSEDQVIFDLLNVRLLHGWLADPQDAQSREIGTQTYNQLIEKLIELNSLRSPDAAAPSAAPPAPPPPPAAAEPPPGDDEEEEELRAALALSCELSGASAPPKEAAAPPAEPALVDPAALVQPETTAPAAAAAAAEVWRVGLAAEEWLDRSASQLTYHGLEQLHRHTSDGGLYVFFRNNHFSTLVKHNGELYLLATDLGYLYESDVIWERLNQVDGDSLLCDRDFGVIDLAARAARLDAERQANADAQYAAQAQAEADAEAAAMREAANAAGGQLPTAAPAVPISAVTAVPAGGHHPGAVQGVAVPSRQSSLPEGFLAPPGAGPAPPPAADAHDADYLLALALQAEEDEAERQQAELYVSQQPQPTQPPPQYHYHSQQGQPGQQPPPQSGRGGAYRPFDAPMDGYPGAERPPRPQPPPQQTPRRRGSDNGGCAIS